MENKTYAGIGSKKADPIICSKAQRLGYYLANRNWTLYSSHAPNFEVNLELGCDASEKGEKSIFLPYPGYNGSNSQTSTPSEFAYKIAQELYPEWNSLNSQNKSIIANVCHQILGENLSSPVSFVLSWTEDGSQNFHEVPFDSGPVYFGIKLASSLGIPVFNLGSPTWRDRFIAHLETFEKNINSVTRVGHVEEPIDTYIGRKCYGFKESIFANPYKLSDNNIESSLKNYYADISGNAVKMHLAKILKGKSLGCYCRKTTEIAPLCHGDLLVAIAENKNIDAILNGSQIKLI